MKLQKQIKSISIYKQKITIKIKIYIKKKNKKPNPRHPKTSFQSFCILGWFLELGCLDVGASPCGFIGFKAIYKVR